MNTQIEFFVEQLQAIVMADLAEEKETNLFGMANDMIACHHEDEFENICQAYEVVKHNLLG